MRIAAHTGKGRFTLTVMSSPPARIVLEGAMFRDGAEIAKDYTADGADQSPALSWRGVPAEAKELVLVLEDLDFVSGITGGRPLIHWLVYNINPKIQGFKEGMPPNEIVEVLPNQEGVYQAHTMYDTTGYRGPQPPPGPAHHYRFTLFAFNPAFGMNPGAGAAIVMNVIEAARDRIVGEGSMTVTYKRQLPPSQ
jgi:Raf kinase inhibitor-like YbhB/YbcL family protein